MASFLLLNILLSKNSGTDVDIQIKKDFAGSIDTCIPIVLWELWKIGKRLLQQPLYSKTIIQIDYVTS